MEDVINEGLEDSSFVGEAEGHDQIFKVAKGMTLTIHLPSGICTR